MLCNLLKISALALLVCSVQAQTAPRNLGNPGNLTVALRQIVEPEPHTLRTQPDAAPLAFQQVQVRNGEKAMLHMGQSLPVRFVEAVGSGREGSAVRYGMVWMQSGQSLTVQPRWPGGRQPVRIAIAVDAASVQPPRGNAELPSPSRSQIATTVNVPLGQWVTIAASGGAPDAQPHTYSSEAAADPRQLVQIRVSVP